MRKMNDQSETLNPADANELNQYKGSLIQELDLFVRQNKKPNSYFHFVLPPNSSIKEQLITVCNKLAKEYQSSNPNCIFEVYTHPTTGAPGVWMSKNGTHYLPELLLNLEKENQAARDKFYAQPTLNS